MSESPIDKEIDRILQLNVIEYADGGRVLAREALKALMEREINAARIDQIDRIEDVVNRRERFTKDVDAYRSAIAMERMRLKSLSTPKGGQE